MNWHDNNNNDDDLFYFLYIFSVIIKIVSLTTVYCNAQWWPPQHSIGGLLNATTFLFLCVLVISNFLSTVFNGPGFLPKEWKPGNSDTKYLQFCNVCLGYKAPRSHHCKKCKFFFFIARV